MRLNRVIHQFTDFPEQVSRAKNLSTEIQESYLQKKISYLEARTKGQIQAVAPAETAIKLGLTPKMAAWMPIEAHHFETWAKEHPEGSLEQFYAQQHSEAIVLTGFIEPYNRSLRHQPGDYILVSRTNHLPQAYLYSTVVDLQSKIGHEVTLLATPRPNHNFAYPAYYVLGVE